MRAWLALVVVFLPAAAAADDAALLRCRDIADSVRRLSCYDELAARVRAGAAAAAGGQTTRPPAAAVATGPAEFGLPDVPRAADINAIESTVPGRFEGWDPGSRIRLANGQVWQVTDDSSRYFYLENPKVTVRRGMLGVYYLEVTGSNWSARVKRVQ